MIFRKNHRAAAMLHILTAFTVICAAVLCSGKLYTVQAANYDIIYDVEAPKLEAERSEDGIVITWVAQTDTDLDGFSGKMIYDKTVFSYDEEDLEITGLAGSVDLGSDTIAAMEQNPRKTVFKIGDAVFTLHFHLKDGAEIVKSTDYTFTLTLDKDAYTYNLSDYSWCGDTFTLTYREEVDGAAVVESEVIPDPDPITNHAGGGTSAQSNGGSSTSGSSQTGTAVSGGAGTSAGGSGTAGTGASVSGGAGTGNAVNSGDSGSNGSSPAGGSQDSSSAGTPSVSWQNGTSSVSSGNASANAPSGSARTSDAKPATGDRSNVFLWTGIAFGAAIVLCAAIFLIVKRIRKQQ